MTEELHQVGEQHTSRAVIIEEVGWLTTIQDSGRRGYASFGVTTSGPVDPVLAGTVNRSVGNDHAATLLETAGGLVVTVEADSVVACSGHIAPTLLRAGERLRVDIPTDRNFEYLAVAGGIEVDEVLGSASQDSMSGLGPPVLQPGSRLGVGSMLGSFIAVDQLVPARPTTVVRVWPGPHLSMFEADAFDRFCSMEWRVEAPVNRIAARLTGSAPERVDHSEVASVALVLGAIQLHPDGAAAVMLADHPTTGGYPVIGVVEHDEVRIIAQTRPGRAVRFISAGRDRIC